MIDRESGELVHIFVNCEDFDPETPNPPANIFPERTEYGAFSDEFDVQLGGFFLANTGFEYCNPQILIYDRDKETYENAEAELIVGIGGRIVAYEIINSGNGFKRIPDIEIIDKDGCPGFGARLFPIMKPVALPDGKNPPPVDQVFCPRTRCYYF